MKYVVAVSGGVDSVVLLDMLHADGHELIVAHFDHGIRDDSAADARFVQAVATAYGADFVMERVELGKQASEETARTYRYDFLRRVAAERNARIATAHHADDVVETIVINLTRGTGWRGLAVLGSPDVDRPLVNKRKADLYQYALEHRLEWVEDSTNASNAYLRNRVRRRLSGLDKAVYEKLLRLYGAQRRLATAIDDEAAQLATTSRHFLTMVDEASADELLRASLAARSLSLTRLQRRKLLLAVKTARAGHTMQPGSGATVDFTSREFIVKHPL